MKFSLLEKRPVEVEVAVETCVCDRCGKRAENLPARSGRDFVHDEHGKEFAVQFIAPAVTDGWVLAVLLTDPLRRGTVLCPDCGPKTVTTAEVP